MIAKQLSLLVLLILLSWSAFTQTTYYNFDDFKAACTNAQPGDEIILASGSYQAEAITIKDVNATEDNPVIIRAEVIGGDTLNGNTYFDLRHCSHIIIQGFVINISEKSTTFKIQTCNNIQISQNILNGEAEAYYNDENDRNSSVWISIQALWDDTEGLSHHNHIHHNIFMNKHTLGNMIRIDGTNDLYVSQYDVIEYNYFKNMGPRATNEMEAIRVGWSAMSESDGYCRIENNLFEECNGDPEIVSVKCNKNTIAHNTFRRCQGTLSLRHGNQSVIDGNFFLGEGAEGTGGVRIYGSDHKIVNNYFEGLTGTKWDAPITLTEGDAEEGDGGLSKHFRIERAIIAHNTLINNHHGIEIGYNNNEKYSKPPRDVIMAYNIVQADTNSIVKYINEPDNMHWHNNVFLPQNNATIGEGVIFSSTEVSEENPQLSLNSSLGYYKGTDQTPTYSTDVDIVGTLLTDIDGQTRTAPTAVGADEFSIANILFKPLHPADVGPAVGEYLFISVSTMSVPVAGNAYEVSVSSNLNWQVENLADWISIENSSGSGFGKFNLKVTENSSGIDRSSVISVKSTNADSGADVIQQITVNQAGTEPAFISLSETELLFESASGSETIKVNSNTSWQVENTNAWVQLTPQSGENNADILISVESNSEVETRIAEIKIHNNAGLAATIKIEQRGNLGTAEKLNIIEAIASTEQNEEGKVNIAANVIDEDFDTRWSGEGNGAYITLKLDTTSLVSFIKVGLYKGSERASYFDVQTSVDGINYFDAVLNISTELTEEMLIIIDLPDTTANYVRIIGYGNSNSSWNSYTEFEVWGKTLEHMEPIGINTTEFMPYIYPNPSSGQPTFVSKGKFNLDIYNIEGKVVYSSVNNYDFEHLQEPLKSGIYFAKIYYLETTNTCKFIVK